MKIARSIFTLFLLVTLIYLRVSSRSLHTFWIDEIEEISHLISVKHLIFEYLPSIPGALPGHYLLTLAMNTIAPGNKFVLGIPGLVANVIVFLLIPYTISLLKLVNKKSIFLVSAIARLGFVLDPRLTYQSMEVRPYSMLPLLWVASVVLCSNLFNLKNIHESKLRHTIRIVVLIFFTILIFTWHFYGFIMVITIYLFMAAREKGSLVKKFVQKKSLYPIIISTFIAIPIWKYFTSGLAHYRHNTFEFLSVFSNTAYMTYSGIFLLLLFFFCFLARKYLLEIKEIIFYLVIIPVGVIFLLDLTQPYYFLYRQFAWVAIPFYIAIGILVNKVYRKHE